MNVVGAVMMLFSNETLNLKTVDLLQHIVAAAPAPGMEVEVVSGSSPQCLSAHGLPEL
jgi:hypothetical protein